MRMTAERLLALTRDLPENEVAEAFSSRCELEELVYATTADDDDGAVIGVVRLVYASCHQSVLFSIARHMPNLLILLLDDRHPAIQVQVLVGLAKHAQPHCYHLGYPGLLPEVYEFGQDLRLSIERRTRTDYDQLCLEVYEGVARHTARYVELLDADDVAVVANAMHVLSFLETWPDHTENRVAALAGTASAAETRMCAWMSYGLHAWRTGAGRGLLRQARDASSDPEPAVRVAQAIAAAHNASERPADLLRDLTEGARLSRLVFDRFPWCAGAIAGPAAEAITTLPLEQDQIVAELFGAFEHQVRASGESCEDTDWEWPVPELVAEHLVRFAFSRFRGRKHEVTPDELDSRQRKILEAFLETECYPSALSHAGVRKLSRRYLGLDPPGPLERILTRSFETEERSWPIWKWWWLTHRGAVSVEELTRQLLNELTPEQVAQLAEDMTRGDYDIQGQTPNRPVLLAQSLMDAVVSQIESYLRNRASALLQSDASISTIAVVMLPLLRLWHDTGQPVDWTYEPLIQKLARKGKALHDQVAAYLPKKERRRLK